MKAKHISNNLDETKELAHALATKLKGGDIVLLTGDLGAGKTTFVKEIAKFLGVNDVVTSPTFTILKSYLGKDFTINHFDMYRLESYEEAYEFGIEDYLSKPDKEISFIEWPEKIAELLDKSYIIVDIKHMGESTREFTITKKSQLRV